MFLWDHILEVTCVGAAAHVAGAWLVRRAPARRTEDLALPACPQCAYSRTGLPEAAACPECGLDAAGADRLDRRVWSRRESQLAVYTGGAIVAAGALSFLVLGYGARTLMSVPMWMPAAVLACGHATMSDRQARALGRRALLGLSASMVACAVALGVATQPRPFGPIDPLEMFGYIPIVPSSIAGVGVGVLAAGIFIRIVRRLARRRDLAA